MQKPKTYKLIDEEHFILRNKTGIQNVSDTYCYSAIVL